MTDTQPPTTKPIRPAGRDLLSVGLFVLLIAVVLGGDLWLKYWSFENVAVVPVEITPLVSSDPHLFWSDYRHEPTVVLPGVLNLQLTSNRGAVFGLGAGNRSAFIAVSVVATAVIGFLFWRSPARSWLLHFALALILGGALGNLYDRVVYAVVRDMLHMLPGVSLPFGLAWPGGPTEVWPWVFNIADVALMLGVGMVLVLTWRTEANAKRAGANTSESEQALAKEPGESAAG